MISINPEIQIRATIKPGSVFLFANEDYYNSTPHYHIALNKEPLSDNVILLVCAVTFDSDVLCNIDQSPFPDETYVSVTPNQCNLFNNISMIDCNRVKEKSIDKLIEKLSNNELKMIDKIEVELLEKLREATILSPAVEERLKKMLKA